ncbi:MAG: PIN domain nuclease [Cyanobacteria bacterium J06559_3]
MKQRIIIDTGPVVAAIRRDTHHAWALQQLKDIQKPLLTCEAVIDDFDIYRIHRGRVIPTLMPEK